MNYVTLIFATLSLSVIAKCGGPAPIAQPKPIDPCQQSGVGYSPVGRIVRMDQVPWQQQRSYGTHVLLDGSGNIQWTLQSSKVNLDSHAGDNRWYRVDGRQSPDHPDLFTVCSISFSP